MVSGHVYAALRARFAAPEWALFFEVSNGTGWHGKGYADAVAMNLYPSRGLEINGVEVKVSRSDWLRELRDPAKAETIFKFCDRWWLAVSDREIVKDGELPITWGLLVLKGGKLVQAVAAPKLDALPVTKQFFAALARRASTASNDEIEAVVRQRLDAERARNKPYEQQRLERAQTELADLRKLVSEFERAADIKIKHWDHATPKIGEAVRFVLEGGIRDMDGSLGIMEGNCERILKVIREVRAAQQTTQVDPA